MFDASKCMGNSSFCVFLSKCVEIERRKSYWPPNTGTGGIFLAGVGNGLAVLAAFLCSQKLQKHHQAHRNKWNLNRFHKKHESKSVLSGGRLLLLGLVQLLGTFLLFVSALELLLPFTTFFFLLLQLLLLLDAGTLGSDKCSWLLDISLLSFVLFLQHNQI
jgi:hypothetical protein